MRHKDLITKEMIKEINTKLRKMKTCLRVVEYGEVTKGVKQYKLRIVDLFIDSDFMIPNPNKDCENLIRGFFSDKGIKLPYSNQVLDIWAYEVREN